MKIAKRLFSLLLCAIICLTLSITSFAAETASIKVSSETVMPGDSVTINVDISNNPGIMAMAFCITYDSDALVYKSYSKGYLSSCTVKDHSDKGHVSFVNVENKDISTNGTIISVIFEVKADAKPGNHPITLANSNRDKHGTKLHNSFSTSQQKFIVPLVVSGGVTVQETCENAGHKYSQWNLVREATCTSTGLKESSCARCGNVAEEIIPITHDFESEWTVDKAATPDEDGIMSRHCTKCDEVTDKITFSYEEIGGDKDDTSSDDTTNDNTSDSGDNSSENTPGTENGTQEDGSQEDGTQEDNSSENISQDGSLDTSSENTTNKKPVINNTVGEKVPLEEVEKLEDYQQNIKPNLNNSDTSSDDVSDKETSSDTTSDDSNTTNVDVQNNTSDTPDKEPSFFNTAGGIITIVICSLLSVGIIALGILLIIRNKKSGE